MPWGSRWASPGQTSRKGGGKGTTEVAGGPLQALYNRRTMAFLEKQLARVRGLRTPPTACQEEVDCFQKQIEMGERLLRRHAQCFDIRDFYKTEQACIGVQDICDKLKDVLFDWGMQCEKEVENRVSEDCVKEDRAELHALLQYILMGDSRGVADAMLQQFEALKKEHDERLNKVLTKIDESSISRKQEIGSGGYAAVHAATWTEKDGGVAVKVPQGDVPIEVLASFVGEAAMQGSLKGSPNIVELHGYTASGWLVMDLADIDLHSLCRRQMEWSTKRSLLLQAATGLKAMHSQVPPLVHSDVKPKNVLVFNSHPGGSQAKITDFGLTFEMSRNKSKTIRKGMGTLYYIAPETYDGIPVTPKSDVFSLGVSMFEVVTGRTPYEDGYSEILPYALMKKKCTEQDACSVRARDCPEPMVDLMRRCCKEKPDCRPTMAEVAARLQELPADWTCQAAQTSCKRCTPVSVNIEASIQGVDLAYLQQNQDLSDSLQRRLVHLFWSFINRFFDIVPAVSISDVQPGSVTFVIQIEFPDETSPELFKEQVWHDSVSLFQADFELLAFRPSMDGSIFDENRIMDEKAPELASGICQTIQEIAEVENVVYSHRMMQFLQEVMSRLAKCSPKLPDSESNLGWKEDAAKLLHQLRCALQLVKQHTFIDIDHLQRTTDAQATVEQTLLQISSFARECGFDNFVDVPSDVCSEDFQQDKESLEACLAYVFEDKHSLEELPRLSRQAWQEVKRIIAQRRDKLKVIAEQEVVYDTASSGHLHGVQPKVYSATKSGDLCAEWRHIKVTARQVAPMRGGMMDLDDFAKLYGRIFDQTRLDSERVVRLHGITRSGAVVMEWAELNLMNWYDSLEASEATGTVGKESTIWGQARKAFRSIRSKLQKSSKADKTIKPVARKIRVLLEAARALLFVHNKGIIYANMKSSDFLVFSDAEDHCLVKIAPPKLTAEPWDCMRKHSSTGRWMAPEIYEGRPPSIESDTFSFGAIMYEVAMQKLPYGQDASELQMMKAKLDGKEPLVIPEGLKQQWPARMLEVMRQCCLRNPQERPSMAEVEDRWDDHLPVSVWEVGEGKEGWPGMVTGIPPKSSNVSGTVGDTMVSRENPFEVGRQDVQWRWHKEQYSFFVLSRWMEGTVDVYENQVLGRGASSIVKKGKWDGMEVAVRFSEASSLEKEARVLEEVRKLEHDNIIKIFGVNTSAGSTERYGSFIVMEMMHCSLRQVLQDPFCVMSLTYLQLMEVILEVARGLVALHSLHPPVTHGDVNPGNILLSATKLDGRLKLAAKISDIDCSRQSDGGQVSNILMGTAGYIAPELYWTAQGSTVDGEKLDVYALGAVMLDCVGVAGRGILEPRGADDPSGMAQCCPKEILDLAHACMHYAASSRCALEDALIKLQALLDDVRPLPESRVKRKLSDLLEHATQGRPSMANDGNATAFSGCEMTYRDLLGISIAIVQELKVLAVSEAASLVASHIVLQREGSCYRAMMMAGGLSGSDRVNNANDNSAEAPGDSIRELGGFIWTLLCRGHLFGTCALEKTMGAHPEELTGFVSKLRGWEVAVSTEQLHSDCVIVSKELMWLQSREWAQSAVSCEEY